MNININLFLILIAVKPQVIDEDISPVNLEDTTIDLDNLHGKKVHRQICIRGLMTNIAFSYTVDVSNAT